MTRQDSIYLLKAGAECEFPDGEVYVRDASVCELFGMKTRVSCHSSRARN